MPVVSPLALRALARILRTDAGVRGLRAGFDRLLALEPPLSFVERVTARAPDRGLPRSASPISCAIALTPATGPLAGAPVVVKDSLDVVGLPTRVVLGTSGDVASRDAELVRRLRAAGAGTIEKGVMTELGIDGLGTLVPGGLRHNACVPGYVPGGSSTGVAMAVASGRARYGVGGDGLGSVRIPAAFHGLVGLKPGVGVLSHDGYTSIAPGMDVPGPITRTAADCARAFQVLAGLPVRTLAPRAPARVGEVRGLDGSVASRVVRDAYERALARLGSERVALEIDGAPGHGFVAIASATTEAALDHAAWFELARSGQAEVMAAVGRALLPHRDEILRRSRALREACLRAFERVELLAMPTTAVPAPALRRSHLGGGLDPIAIRGLGHYTPLANVTGLPAIAIPSGVDDRGRPLSIMFVGPPRSEELLLSVALALDGIVQPA